MVPPSAIVTCFWRPKIRSLLAKGLRFFQCPNPLPPLLITPFRMGRLTANSDSKSLAAVWRRWNAGPWLHLASQAALHPPANGRMLPLPMTYQSTNPVRDLPSGRYAAKVFRTICALSRKASAGQASRCQELEWSASSTTPVAESRLP